MKKTVLAIVCMIAFAVTKAQSVKFGVKAGLNIAFVHIDHSEAENLDFNSLLGFHGGITLEAKLSDSFSIQPEILYVERGATIKKETFLPDYYDSSAEEATFSADYISLPIMAKYYLVKGFFLEAGPEVSFLVNDEVIGSDFSIEDTRINNYDLGANFGFGYQFDNGLFVQSRYTLGLVNMLESREMKNGVFQFSLGYQF